ncbi:hypothetical protein ACFQ9X_56690 [Catenulispora yoronensis]
MVANPRQVEALIAKVGLHGSHRDTREFSPGSRRSSRCSTTA